MREAWTNEHTYKLVKRYMHRPAEQLYHTARDPFELTNLADEDSLTDTKQRLSRELTRWMEAQGDPGLPCGGHRQAVPESGLLGDARRDLRRRCARP